MTNKEINSGVKRTTYEKWCIGEIGGFGSFHTALLKTYQLGDADNRQLLADAFPDWFKHKA